MNIDPLLGEIAIWPGLRIPKGWVLCDGSKLPIAQYQALFALLGTTFGGDGSSTFGIPDLRGVTAVGANVTKSSGYQVGDTGGADQVTLSVGNLPRHSHAFGVTDSVGSIEPIVDAIPAVVNGKTAKYFAGAPDTAVSPLAIDPPERSSPGVPLPHANMQPFLALNYIIATAGLYPTHT